MSKNAFSTDRLVSDPYKLFDANGVPYGTAGKILNKLEKAGYIEKRTNGGTSIIYIKLLKIGELGEDILGAPKRSPVPVAKEPRLKKVPKSKTEKVDESHEAGPPASQAGAVMPQGAQFAPGNGVMLFVDYYNIYMRMAELKTEFPLRELILTAREIGKLKLSLMFIPSHIAARIQMIMRQGVEEDGRPGDGSEGYRIISCPPVKLGGKDSVDKTIDEFVNYFLGHPDIGTFILVSGDGDFGDTRGNIANARKVWITFKVDVARRAMASSDGRIILLMNYRNNNAERPEVAVNVFELILSGLEQGTLVVPERDANLLTLKAIISGLKEGRWATDKNRKGFVGLYQLAWEDLRRSLGNLSTKDSFAEAFTALHKHGVIVQRQQSIDPKVYYVFNPQSKIVPQFDSL